MKTAIAISPMMTNVLSVATIPPAAVKASHMTRIAPRIVPMIRPMSPVCARGLWQAAAAPAVPSGRYGHTWRSVHRVPRPCSGPLSKTCGPNARLSSLGKQ